MLKRMRGYEPRGREFESLRARHKNKYLRVFQKSLPPITLPILPLLHSKGGSQRS